VMASMASRDNGSATGSAAPATPRCGLALPAEPGGWQSQPCGEYGSGAATRGQSLVLRVTVPTTQGVEWM